MGEPDDCDPYEGYDECWNCGGTGEVYSCPTEYACVGPEVGCDLCARRCNVCRPRPTPPSQEKGT